MVDTSQSETQQTQIMSWQGTAAESLIDGQITLPCIIQQLSPALEGTFGAGKQTSEVSSTNRTGVAEKVEVTTTNAITATWVGQSNRKYPPFVQKGEQVNVIKYGDSDKYYWDSNGRDANLRKTERFRLEIGATPSAAQEKTDENTYFLELDSVTKRVMIKTSKKNGETTTWALVLDGANGIACLSDDQNNRVYIDTAQSQVQLSNNKDAAIQLMGENLTILAPKTINFKAGQQVTFDAPMLTYQTTSGGGVTQMNVKSLAINASDGITLGGPTVGISGAAKVSGPLVTGPMRAEGYATGSAGGAYSAGSTNPEAGTSNSPKNAADNAAPNGAMRHAAAQEQLLEICQKLELYFDEISAKISAPSSYSGTLTGLAIQSKMNKNQGE